MRRFWFWIVLMGIVASLVATPSPETARTRLADGFDFPVGKPDGEGYYIARGFLPYHPGEDWNSVQGGNSDLGAPVYSIGNGLVVFARDAKRGWGNVVIVRHVFFSGGRLQTCDSFYAHLERVTVREGQHVMRGTQVGTIGTNRGMYTAHLHFEIRKNLAIGIHRSAFRNDLTNYYLPSQFIRAHRQLPGAGRTALVAINTFTLPNSMFDPPVNETLYRRSLGARYAQQTPIDPRKRRIVERTLEARRDYKISRYDDINPF